VQDSQQEGADSGVASHSQHPSYDSGAPSGAAESWWALHQANCRMAESMTYHLQRKATTGSLARSGSNDPSESAPMDWQLDHEREKKRAMLRLLAPFVPLFWGVQELRARDVCHMDVDLVSSPPSLIRRATLTFTEAPPERAASSSPHESREAHDSSSREETREMITLENITHGFVRPCVLDVKMGSRQYGLRPTAVKRQSKERKAVASTSATYGIRLAGYKRWDEATQQYDVKSKIECRHFSLKELEVHVALFLGHRSQLKRALAEQLRHLRHIFSQQTVFRFFTSSLLFVYDATRPVETCRIAMVDFAYTYEQRELKEANDPDADFQYDVGYLKALDTLQSLFA
jgi:hypothetical protein